MKMAQVTGSTVLGKSKAQLISEPINFNHLNKQECLFVINTVNQFVDNYNTNYSLEDLQLAARSVYYVSKDALGVIHSVTTLKQIQKRIAR